jgi:hypothetical protein
MSKLSYIYFNFLNLLIHIYKAQLLGSGPSVTALPIRAPPPPPPFQKTPNVRDPAPLNFVRT